MADVCLRNMSCRCKLCMGEDVAELMSISKSISSNITYEDENMDGESAAPPPPAPTLGRMTNSPPIPTARKTFPRAIPRRPPPQQPKAEPMDVEPQEDVAMAEPSPMRPSPAPLMAAPVPAATVSIPMPMSIDTSMDMAVDAVGAVPAPPAAAPAPPAAIADGTNADGLSVDAITPKLTDKNWKVRKEGFDEVKTLCEHGGVRTNDVLPFLDIFPKMCEDVNASAMEAGIQAVLAYTLHVEPFEKGIVAGVMKRITDKGFAGRPGTVKICDDLVMAFVEAGAAEDTIQALIEGTKNKKPKVPPACVNNILEALKAFGPRVIPIQTVKAALPTLCESTVNGVRPLALNILVEIHRWTGPGLVQDIVSNLRQAQQTEYEALTKDVVVGQAAPTKFVRGAKPPPAAGGVKGSKASGGASTSAGGGPAAFDPREFAETVDLLAKLPRTEFKAKLALPKWSEKVEALKIILDLIGPVPKLANGDYYELVNTLKLLSNDSNVNIVAKSVEVLGVLSDGLRKNFTLYSRMMFPELMRKLSDKKSVILNATNNALDLFLQHSMTIDMMMEEIKFGVDASKNKSPQARVQTIGFLVRCIEKQMININDKSLMLEFGGLFMIGMDDVDPTVRKAGIDAFVVALKSSPDVAKWLQSMLDDISRKNPRSFKAIQQSMGLSGSAVATTATSRPSSASSTSSRNAAAETMEVDASVPEPSAAPPFSKPAAKKPTRGPPSRFGAKPSGDAPAKTAPVKKPAGASSTGSSASSGGAGGDFTPMAISVAPEEAEDIIAELNISTFGTIQEGLASSKWMERKEAIELLETFAKENPGSMTMRTIEALTVYLSKQVKDFKDSNINVLRSAFLAIGTFAENAASKFPRGVVCLVVPSAADKIGDRKASEAIRNMIIQLCEATTPKYVLGCLMNHMPNVKTPLAHIEALAVLGEAVKDFGVTACNPRGLIDFAKGGVGLESSNPKVRTGAVSVLSIMYSQLGPALLPILNLESWKPALAAIVEAEFKKTGYDPATAMASVSRQVKDDNEGGAKKTDAGALFGRVDVSNQITKDLMADMKSEEDKAAWKKRLAAMEAVQSICEGAGCAIEFTKPVQELLRALKARLNDSNANLKVKAAQVIGTVATSIGPDVGKMSKILGPSLLIGVADNKKNMHIASIEALHKWVRHNNQTSSACMESLLSPVSEALLNPVGRAGLLAWAAEHLKDCEKLDLNCLVVPTVQCLMDKSSEARENALLVLAEVMKSVGKDVILTTGCRDIKPAQMRTLQPLIQKVCENVAESSSTAPIASAPQAPPPQVPASAQKEVATLSSAVGSRLARPASLSSKPNNTGNTSIAATGTRLPLSRPGSFQGALPEPDDSSPSLLLKMSTTKNARLARAQYNKWIFEPTSVSETNNRKSEIEAEWKPFLTPEFHAKLFAPSLEKGMMGAITDLMTCISNQPQEVLAALDLIFKWCTLRLVDNNVQALAKLLEVLVRLMEMLKEIGYQLDDVEASILLPYLLQESGQSKPRFRVRFRDIMKLICDVYSLEKYAVYLMDCFNGCKNTKSRCECIDIVEYIVSNHGFHVLGKKCVKDVGKYVCAHEKDLRESAINAIVTMYTRAGADLDRFFRFAGVTTQQGMDLVTARIKHLPAGSLSSQPSQQQSSLSGFGSTTVTTSSLTLQQSSKTLATPRQMPVATDSFTPMSGLNQLNNAPAVTTIDSYSSHFQQSTASQGDEDVEMATPNKPDANAFEQENGYEANGTIEDLLLRPIEQLLTETKEIVDESNPAYAEGVDALKGLYAIINAPSGESELQFLRSYVNEIITKLCDCIHASFGLGDSKKPLVLYVLSLSLSILSLILNSDAVDHIQRFVVERVILEVCSKMLDPRLEDFASVASTASLNLATMSAEKKRMLYIFKALYKAMRSVTENVKPGDVYPSVIHLLQRIMRNEVGDYNSRDTFNHLMKKDSLDQLVGRMLIKISNVQANALNPFEGIDIYGVLMQMHTFFSTLPKSDLFAVQIANDNMQKALQIIADSMMKVRQSSFEKAVNDLPVSSPVRDVLAGMGYSLSMYQNSLTASSSSSSMASSGLTSRLSSGFSAGSSNVSGNDNSDSVTRRLFDAGPSTSTTETGISGRFSAPRESLKARMGLKPAPTFRSGSEGSGSLQHQANAARAVASLSSTTSSGIRSSFTSFNEFSANRSSSLSNMRASFTSSSSDIPARDNPAAASSSTTTQLLRERLERVRKF